MCGCNGAPSGTRCDADQGPPAHARVAGNGSSGGGEQHAKPKKQAWWERGTDWVSEHKNQLVGAAVGIVTFVGCEAATGGVGTLGCAAVAGAAANITTGFMDGNIHNAQDFANSFITGAAGGILAIPLAAVDLGRQANAISKDVQEGDVAGALGHGALGALDVMAVVGGTKALGGKGRCLNSFAPGTLVLLDHGVTKPISEIKIGDKVVASDPQADDTDTTLKEVEALHDNLDTDLVDLTVTLDDGRSSVINTTQHHPIWDQTTSEWVDAGALEAGHSLRDSDGGSTVTVTFVRPFTGAQHMLNLTVAKLHTYYVVAAGVPVLVHNCPTGLSGAGGAGEGTVRMRHYTNSAGAAGIMESKVIRASDQNKVFLMPAKSRLLSPRDAESKLGIGRGRGRKVVEFDAPAGRVYSRHNSTMGITEWVADGDLPTTNPRVVR